MRQISLRTVPFAAVFLLTTVLLTAAPLKYEVTITNLTKGEPFSPTVVILHKPEMEPIFTLGQPASEGIWSIAEDGDTGPLFATASVDPDVYDVQVTDGPFLPGHSVTVTLTGGNNWVAPVSISLAGMLGISNDAFYALNGERIHSFIPPFGKFTNELVFMPPAYDSGTEVNSESCATIPGGPCSAVKVRDTEGAEGYVYVHSGIHGIGDLDPSLYDWNNPVAKIVIRLVR